MAKIRIRSKYRIWDKGHLVPAWTRKPKSVEGVIELKPQTIQEHKLGIKWYLPHEEDA